MTIDYSVAKRLYEAYRDYHPVFQIDSPIEWDQLDWNQKQIWSFVADQVKALKEPRKLEEIAAVFFV